MYKLKLEIPNRVSDIFNVSMEIKQYEDTLMLIFTEDLEYVESLLETIIKDKLTISLTLDNENCQFIFPHCRIQTYISEDPSIAVCVNYGTTN